jgi:hypothetical protein
MEKEFVNYEQALELKELGFDEPCNTCYDKLEMVASYGENVFDYKNYNTSGYVVSRPLYQQAFRWFREKYGLNYEISYAGKPNEYHAFVNDYIYGNNGNNPSVFSYEDAELECLKKIIKIVKNK